MRDKKGAWYSYKEDKIGQGHDNAVKFLEDNPDIAIDLEKTLRAQLFPNQKYVSSFVKTDQAAESGAADKTPSGSGEASAAAKTGVSKAAASVKPESAKTDKEADAQAAPAGKKSMLEKAALAAEKTESFQASSTAASAAHKSKPGSAFDGDNELF